MAVIVSMELRLVLAALVCGALVSGCGGGGGDGDGDANEAVIFATRALQEPRDVIDVGLFSTIAQVRSSERVECTLEGGFRTDCLQITLAPNPPDYLAATSGAPLCPVIGQFVRESGVFFYDAGAITVDLPRIGNLLLNLEGNIYNFLESSGFDIIDEDGNARIEDPANILDPDQTLFSFCVQGTPSDNAVTIRIPVRPLPLQTARTLTSNEFYGVHVDGIPMMGPVPSMTGGIDGTLPPAVAKPTPVDFCGGRIGAEGFYQLHLAPENTTPVFSTGCPARPNPGQALLTGYARDGYPVYGPLDSNGSAPEGLDECNGHTLSTNEFIEPIYHYHVRPADNSVVVAGGNSFLTGFSSCFKGDPVRASEALVVDN